MKPVLRYKKLVLTFEFPDGKNVSTDVYGWTCAIPGDEAHAGAGRTVDEAFEAWKMACVIFDIKGKQP